MDRVEQFFQTITNRRRFFIILAAVMIFVVAYIGMTGLWDDVYHYWYNIDYFYTDGLIPYRDYVFEYPPFSLVIFIIPRIFSWDSTSFNFAYAIFSALAYAVTAWLVLDMVKDNERAKGYVCLLLLVIPLVSLKFIVTRNDIFAALLAVLALWLVKKDRRMLACVVIGVGVMTKLYPILILGPIIADHFARKDYKNVVMSVLIVALTCVLISLPFYLIDPSTAFDYLHYHSDRDIQIESVVGSIMMVAYYLGLTTLYPEWSSGSNNMVGELPDLISPYLFYVEAAALAIIALYILFRFIRVRTDENGFRMICLSSILLVTAFVVFNKVYSAQYMIWILTLSPLLVMTIFGKEQKDLMTLTLVFGVVSTVAYLFYNWDFIRLSFFLPQAAKNTMTVVLLVYYIHILKSLRKDEKSTLDIDK